MIIQLDPDLVLLKKGFQTLYQEGVKQIERLIEIAQSDEELIQQHLYDCSGWSVKEHLEHLCITSRSTLVQIEKSLMSEDSQSSLNADGEKLFKLLYFPRGETQAPDFAHPNAASMKKVQSSLRRLQKGWNDFADKLDELEHGKGTSDHPFLGYLNPCQWVQFMCMHQHHHLGIIDDLLSKLKP